MHRSLAFAHKRHKTGLSQASLGDTHLLRRSLSVPRVLSLIGPLSFFYLLFLIRSLSPVGHVSSCQIYDTVRGKKGCLPQDFGSLN